MGSYLVPLESSRPKDPYCVADFALAWIFIESYFLEYLNRVLEYNSLAASFRQCNCIIIGITRIPRPQGLLYSSQFLSSISIRGVKSSSSYKDNSTDTVNTRHLPTTFTHPIYYHSHLPAPTFPTVQSSSL